MESFEGVRKLMSTQDHTYYSTPLLSGMLTGKFSRDAPPTDPSSSRVAWAEVDPMRVLPSMPSYSQYVNDDKYWALIDTMKEIAKKHNATVAQIAIAWLLKQPTVTSVILGARTKQQLADNLASVNVNLTDEEVSIKWNWVCYHFLIYTFRSNF